MDNAATTGHSGSIGETAAELVLPIGVSYEPVVRTRLSTDGYQCRADINFDLMISEQARLSTFRNVDYLWPVRFIEPADCAKVGFFFLKDGDKVQCAFCRGVAGEWEDGDVPKLEHKKHFPRCPFICNLPVGNIPISGDENEESEELRQPLQDHHNFYGHDVCGPFERLVTSENGSNIFTNEAQVLLKGPIPLLESEDTPNNVIQTGSGPAHKQLVTLDSRLKTFVNWPESTGQEAKRMADAGFYYYGTEDHVKCFYCEGGLRNWEAGDNPWLEHARWFGSCPYILLIKGEDFVKIAVDSKPNEESENNGQYDSDESSSLSSGKDSSATSRTPSTSDSENSPEGLEHSAAIVNHKKEKLATLCNLNGSGSSERSGKIIAANGELDVMEELRRLKEARQCKICMDNEIGVVFLPCGHLVSCVRCATALSHCALCRQPMKALVRTYLS